MGLGKLKAGRELDALVAEKIFGCKITWTNGVLHLCGNTDHDHLEIPNYSTDIAAAWEVVEKQTWFCVEQTGDGLWHCSCQNKDGVDVMSLSVETPMLAICLAALKAVSIQTQNN